VHTDVEPLEVGERLRSVVLGEMERANRESAVSRFSSTASMLTGRHVRAWICAKVTRRATSGSQTKAAPPTSATPRIKTSHRRAHGQTRLGSGRLGLASVLIVSPVEHEGSVPVAARSSTSASGNARDSQSFRLRRTVRPRAVALQRAPRLRAVWRTPPSPRTCSALWLCHSAPRSPAR
jgi:hypothetical protein